MTLGKQTFFFVISEQARYNLIFFFPTLCHNPVSALDATWSFFFPSQPKLLNCLHLLACPSIQYIQASVQLAYVSILKLFLNSD